MKMLMQQQQGLHKHSVNTEYLNTYFFQKQIYVYIQMKVDRSQKEKTWHI